MIFALIGNQNCGKTTLFNQMTGSNQHVGNFPGVTVDQKMGKFSVGSAEGSVVDLPGIYSLRPYTNEEIVTRDFLLKEKPDGIINIVDKIQKHVDNKEKKDIEKKNKKKTKIEKVADDLIEKL